MGCAQSANDVARPRRDEDDGSESAAGGSQGEGDEAAIAKRHSRVHSYVAHHTDKNVFSVYDTHGPPLGSGMTGTVRVVTHRETNERFAMKTLYLNRVSPGMVAQLRREIEILKHLDHPNIVKLYET